MSSKRRRMGTNPLTWIVNGESADVRPKVEKPREEKRVPKKSDWPDRHEEPDRSDRSERPEQLDVLRVADRPLSPILADYFLCKRCGTVGRGRERAGPSCLGCDQTTEGAGFYFKKSVHTVIDLMQDTYQSTSLTARGPTADIPQLDLRRSLALLLFFCRLFEIVQEHVLRHIMTASRIPDHVANRLLADNRDPSRRVVKIFPTVTGESWRKAIDELTVEQRVDYVDTVRFLKTAVSARDALAVASDLSVFDDEIGKACMLRLDPLLGLHAALHNRYVPPLLWRDAPRDLRDE